MSKRHASFSGRVSKVSLQPKKTVEKSKSKRKVSSSSSEVSDDSEESSMSPEPVKKGPIKTMKKKQPEVSSQNSDSKDDEQSSSPKIQDNDISSTPLISQRSSSKPNQSVPVKKKQRSDLQGQKQESKKQNATELIKNLTKKVQHSPQREEPKIIHSQSQMKIEQKMKNQVSEQAPVFPTRPQRPDQVVEDGNDKIKANENYKPKNFSEPFNILRAMFLLEAHVKPTSLDQIQQKCRVLKGSPCRQLYSHMERLVKNNFVKIQDRNESKIWLSAKGQKFIMPKMALTQKGKDQNPLIKQQLQAREAERKKALQKSKNQKNQAPKGEHKKQKKVIYFRKNEFDEYPKQLLSSSKNADKIKLIINEAALSMQQQVRQFSDKLQIEGSIKFQLQRINTNINFFWQVENKILDCFAVLIRHTKTDLEVIKHALSDSRYCSCSKFIIIVQERSDDDFIIVNSKDKQKTKKIQMDEQREIRKRKQLQYFVFDARAAGFTVFRTQNIDQTFFALRKITSLLSKKIRIIPETGESIKHYGPLQKLDQWFKISKVYNQRRVAIRCLKRLKCLSLASMRRIAQKLPTMGSLFGKLVRLDTNDERTRFMSWFLQKHDSNPQGNHLLVNLFFLNNYQDFKWEINKVEEGSEQEKKSFDRKLQARFQQFEVKKQKKSDARQPKPNTSQKNVEMTKKQSKISSESRNQSQSKVVQAPTKKNKEKQPQVRKMYEYESDDQYITKN